MIIHLDFKELLQSLEKNKVDYMIVGGFAVAFHGYVRNTKDIDIFYRLCDENIGRLKAAMVEFGFSEQDAQNTQFIDGTVVSFGVPPLRVDLLNQIDGVAFENAAETRIRGKYGDAEVWFISRDDLLVNKQATPRSRINWMSKNSNSA